MLNRRISQDVADICDYLDPAIWYPRPTAAVGLDLTGATGHYTTERNHIFISLMVSQDTYMDVLAHEVRHWWQYHAKWLCICPDNWVWWQGERHTQYSVVKLLATTGSVEDYYRLPWERDAEDFANEYRGHLAKTLAA